MCIPRLMRPTLWPTQADRQSPPSTFREHLSGHRRFPARHHSATTDAELPPSRKSSQQSRSSSDSSNHKPSALHRFIDRRLVRPNPGIFRIILRRRVKHRKPFGSFGGFTQSHLENLGQVQGVAVSLLSNLLAAAKAIGNDEPIGWSLSHGRQKFELANGFRDVVFFFLEAERTGHTAASRSRRSELNAHSVKHSFLRSHLHDGFVMTMSVNECAAWQLRRREVFRALLKKFAQQKDLL